MTIRDYLNTLSDEEFANAIHTKMLILEADLYVSDLEVGEVVDEMQIRLEKWLKQEYKAEVKNNVDDR